MMKSQWHHNLRWFGVYAGTPNVGMFAHKDRHATSSFQVQLGGVKRWRLCDPNAHLGDEAMYSKFKVHADGLARTANLGAESPFEVDYGERPLFRLARCYDGKVREGDVVYYPADWWHQTLTQGEGLR